MNDLAILGGAPVRTDPFPAWPHAGPEERRWVEKVLAGNRWFAGARGDDPESLGTLFGQRFASMVGVRHGLPVSNGSVSLEVALRALGVGPEDEVIVPAYTFVSTATSVLMLGAVPVFADIDSESYCLDVKDCARRITPRTRAIIPVHLGGQMTDMTALVALAGRYGVHIVEDAAQAIDARWDGKASGSWGAFGSFSFQANKTITSGEGGLVATDDPDLAEKATAFRAFGRFGSPGSAHAGRSSGLMSQRLSSNYRLSEFQAAVLLGQLERFPGEDARRQENAAILTRLISRMAGVRHVRLDRAGSRHAYYYYVIRYEPGQFAGLKPTVLAKALAAEGVPFVPGDAVPTYRHPIFQPQSLAASLPRATIERCRQAWSQFEPGLPAAEAACEQTLILRHQVLLSDTGDIAQIAEALAKVQAHAPSLAARPAAVPA